MKSLDKRRSAFSEAMSKATAVKVRNVMNSLLWLNAVALPVLLGAAFAFRSQPLLATILILGALVLPAGTLNEFRYFARRDPQRLQSEEYLIAQTRLMIESKNSSETIDASLVPASANPELGSAEDEAAVLLPPAEVPALLSNRAV